MPASLDAAAAPAPTSFLDLPIACQDYVFKQLPANSIPLSIRQLSKELRQRYLQHTTVQAGGNGYLPVWAVLAALPHIDAYSQKRQLMPALARRGDLEGMQLLLQQPQPSVHRSIRHSTHAWSGGRTASSTRITTRAASSAQIGSHASSASTGSSAAAGSHWIDSRAVLAAASAGHLHIVRWLVEERGCSAAADNTSSSICAGAAYSGHQHILEYLRAQRPQFAWASDACAAAARGGHLQTLQWLRSNGCLWCRLTMHRAAERGHLAVVRWAYENQCPWDPMCCNTAAVNGHLSVLEYLLERGYPTGGSDLCSAAAYGGRKEVLLWLREHGHAWTNSMCTTAAHQGNLQLLRWLRERESPCPWDKGVTKAAALSLAPGAVQCLQYALDSGCPWDMEVYRLVQDRPRLRHVQFPGMQDGEPLLEV